MHRYYIFACLQVSLTLVTGCNPRLDMTPKQIVEAPSTFQFSGSDYPIKSAVIKGFLDVSERPGTDNGGRRKSLQWFLEISGAQIKGDDLGPPRVSYDGLDIEVSRWRDIDGFDQQWSDWENPRTGEQYAMTYHSGHEFVDCGCIRVVGRHRNEFRVIANGGVPSTTPFRFDATFMFSGVKVDGTANDDEGALKRRLDAELPGNDLVLTTFARESVGGRRIASATFSPPQEKRK